MGCGGVNVVLCRYHSVVGCHVRVSGCGKVVAVDVVECRAEADFLWNSRGDLVLLNFGGADPHLKGLVR